MYRRNGGSAGTHHDAKRLGIMIAVRTTITIDPDVERLLRDAMHERRLSMARIVNEALRAALASSAVRDEPYAFPTFDCGPSLVDLTKAGALTAALDDDLNLRKMSEGR